MTTPRPPRRHHHRVDETPGLELPSTFAGDSHEPDRDALAWLAAGRLEAEARGTDRRRDDGWQVVAPHLADVPDSDVTREFWGDAPRRRRPTKDTPRRRPSTSAATGSIERTRTHRVVPASADGSNPSVRDDSVARNPLFTRLAALAVIGVLLVPLVMGVRSATSGSDLGLRTMTVSELPAVLQARPASPGLPDAMPDASSASPSDADETAVLATAGGDLETPSHDPPADVDAPVAAEQAAAATAAASCSLEYTVVAGDYWLRLADGSGVDLAMLLAANGATIETPLYPGDEVCLPEGATRPAPPTTQPVTESASPASAASTNDSANSTRSTSNTSPSTAPPATTAPTTAPPTTAPPTTAPPTTAAPAPTAANPPEAEVRKIIEEVFPDDQHEMAFNVARRESGFRADAYNGWCCYGIFQIHWQAHRSWLQGHGITSTNQLYDARTNIEIAYQIYQRAGGWGPWSQTAY